MKKLYTADRESGNKIEEIRSLEEGKKKITEYEEEDKRDGCYTYNFYDVIDSDGISII